jgi:hypothetical protein
MMKNSEKHPLTILKELANNQKTISSSKLIPLLDALDRTRIGQAEKINRQSNVLNKMNQELQKLRHKLKEFDNLRVKHSRLKTEHILVLEKLKRSAE